MSGAVLKEEPAKKAVASKVQVNRSTSPILYIKLFGYALLCLFMMLLFLRPAEDEIKKMSQNGRNFFNIGPLMAVFLATNILEKDIMNLFGLKALILERLQRSSKVNEA